MKRFMFLIGLSVSLLFLFIQSKRTNDFPTLKGSYLG
jgi:hypothetical protein